MAVELAELLASLRSEIDRARLEAAGKDVRFRINSIDLELHVSVEKQAQGKGGVKFWVASVEGSGSAKSAKTHVIKVSLDAQTTDASGQPKEVLTGDDITDLLDA